MNSHKAHRLACGHGEATSEGFQDSFSFPKQSPSRDSNVTELPQSRALEASWNETNFRDNQPAGLGLTPRAAGQPTKRLRSNSDEASMSRLSQVQAWLLLASSDDVEKIWHFLDASMALSSNGISRPIIRPYPVGLQNDDMSTMIDNSSHHLDIPYETIPQSDLVAPGRFDFYQWMQPMKNSDDINITSNMGNMSSISRISQESEIYGRGSVPSQQPHYCAQLHPHSHLSDPGRSYASNALQHPNTSAAAAATQLLRQEYIIKNSGRSRDSGLSASSYNSNDTDMSVNTKHSSITSLGSQASHLSRQLPPQKTMSSSVTSKLVKKSHHQSSSLSGAFNPPSDIPCTYSDCKSTFTREPDRARHEASIHNSEAGYTCLLDTCNTSCPDNCREKLHRKPYRNARADKMKEHLEKSHGWSITPREIPRSFLGSFEWQQRGWTCRACGTDLGSWYDNEEMIAAHSDDCNNEGLHTSFKRLSVEKPSGLGQRKLGHAATDKELPRRPRVLSAEDEEFW